MNAKVCFIAPVRLATIRYCGPYGEPLSRFFHSFQEACLARRWTGDSYGIAIPGEQYVGKFDNPLNQEAHSCRYDLGVAVSANAVIDGGFTEGTLQGGRYAVFEFLGTPLTIGEAWEAAFRKADASGAAFNDGRPPFEWYRATDALHADGSFRCALCIPLSS